jgi:SAM-dependent methyltransferase
MSSRRRAETVHDRIIGLYEENAAAWDRQRGRDLIEKPWLDLFAARLPASGTILDLGCGMGEPIARYLIGLGFRLTGCDSSPSLIAICRERFPDHDWIVADMRGLDLRRRFDGLIVWHSSFHLAPDAQRALFPKLAAHTEPGGHLMFTSGEEEGIRIGEWQGEPLYHASLAPDDYRSLLDDNGFDVLEHRPSDPQCGDATVWLAQMRPASGLDGSA